MAERGESVELRRSGIAAIGPQPWGSHLCHFYETVEDLFEIVVPYFRAGLEDGEKCVWILVQPIPSRDEVVQRMRSAMADIDEHLRRGNLEIRLDESFYVHDGTVDPERIVATWQRDVAAALAAGYAGLRAHGNVAWLTEDHRQPFSTYERQLHDSIRALPMMALCTYSVRESKAADVFDIAGAHDIAIARRRGASSLLETPDLAVAKNELLVIHRGLENQIAERTHELSAANAQLQSEIARREQVEIKLRQEEELYRLLAENVSDVIALYDMDSNQVYYTSPSAKHVLGRPLDETMAMAHPDDREAMKAAARRLAAGESSNLTFRTRHADGNWRTLEASATPMLYRGARHVLTVLRDVTDREAATRQLRASEQRFREIADTIDEVFWIADPVRNEITYVSPAFERIWGFSLDQVQAPRAAWLDSVHVEDRDRAIEANARHDGRAVDYRIMRADGSIRWIRDHIHAITRSDGSVALLGSAQDITEQQQLAEQLRQSQKMEAIGQLAGGIAHDFNNILQIILMESDSGAFHPPLPALATEAFDGIRLAAERATSLTRQMLLFSRRQVMQTRAVDINDVITQIGRMLQRIIGEDVRLVLRLHPAVLVVRVDRGMLDQVLLNLCVNARDAMPRGGQIIIRTSELLVKTGDAPHPDARPGRYARLDVTDTGEGIAPDVLPRIFEPFFTTKRDGQGTGLGLATVYGIVKQHDGWLAVESTLGKGTTFHLYLPRVDQAAQSDASRAELRGGTETILLVEDDHAVRAATHALLERFGYTVVAAADGVAALHAWRTHAGRIDLLVTDLVMPEAVSGTELAAQLRELDPTLKVIFCSGYSAELAGTNAERLGDTDFLQKPFLPEVLLSAIRKQLERKG